LGGGLGFGRRLRVWTFPHLRNVEVALEATEAPTETEKIVEVATETSEGPEVGGVQVHGRECQLCASCARAGCGVGEQGGGEDPGECEGEGRLCCRGCELVIHGGGHAIDDRE
jgi:hypothetical protein